MQQFIFQKPWDYELIDSGHGFRLERWGMYTLQRPDPQAIWQPQLPEKVWQAADAKFERSWHVKSGVNQPWIVSWNGVKLHARLTPFKHTGLFAEQSANWEWLTNTISNSQFLISNKIPKPQILNLFGYTGAATVILAKLGCFVTHVDASKPAIAWAKENQELNKLPADSVRWILDDAAKFVKRELKRGVQYDGILLDPPAFGHSPTGKTWKFGDDLPPLLRDCAELLSKNARFLAVNAYATNSSPIALQNVLEDSIKKPGSIESGELMLKQQTGRLLSTGILARWTATSAHK